MDLELLPKPAVPILPAGDFIITATNAKLLDQFNKLKIDTTDHWHKFTIKNGAPLDKGKVLEDILGFVAPNLMVPVKYEIIGCDAAFLARNCGSAILTLCENSLTVEPADGSPSLLLEIHICLKPTTEYNVNMQALLRKGIEKRSSQSKEGCVDLSEFHKEPDTKEVEELLFCPLSQPRFLNYVLCVLEKIMSPKVIILSRNNLCDLQCLDRLQKFPELTVLDLSNNKVDDAERLAVLGQSTNSLKQLNLNNNPLCAKYKNETTYVKEILMRVPTLNKLDGVPIFVNLPQKQVSLCVLTGADLLDQFLHHYFTLYDSDRRSLKHTYHEKATFSLSCNEVPGLPSSNILNCYLINNSNLLLKTTAKKTNETLITTNDNVVDVLCSLPSTEHDIHSFKIDLVLHTESMSVIFVNGIFREVLDTKILRSFSRTFLLKKVSCNEFTIANDLLMISNPTEEESKVSFQDLVNKKNVSSFISQDERDKTINILTKITTMNPAYSKKCLQDVNWNLTKALEVFKKNYDAFKIPVEAFSNIKK